MVFQQEELASKLKQLKSVVPSRALNVHLENILFQHGVLYANNLEISMSANVGGGEEEIFLIPPKAIALIDTLPKGKITIEVVDEAKHIIQVKAKGVKAKFQSMDPTEFAVPDYGNKEQAPLHFNGESLLSALQSVEYAVASDVSRPTTTGVLFEIDGKEMQLVGCDGHRIAWATIALENEEKKNSFIVPRRTVQKLLSVGFSDEVTIEFNERQAFFTAREFTIGARLIDGEYLDYKKAFPEPRRKIEVNTEKFAKSIERAIICSVTGREQKAKIILHMECKTITVTSSSATEEFSEPLECETEDPATLNLTICFNGFYLREMLKHWTAETITFEVDTNVTPLSATTDGRNVLILPSRMAQ